MHLNTHPNQPNPPLFCAVAGTTTLRVICPEGSQWIFMRYGESMQADGHVLNQYGNIMNSNYTCAGTGDVETYTTLFSYYGFRYIELTNWPGVPDEGSFTGHFIHSNVGQTGSFNSDNDQLNNIQHLTRFASLSNLMDVPTDCPQRERRGWLGDAQLSAETTISNFDMSGFYTKWMRDLRDSQEFLNSDGQLPDCGAYIFSLGVRHHSARPGHTPSNCIPTPVLYIALCLGPTATWALAPRSPLLRPRRPARRPASTHKSRLSSTAAHLTPTPNECPLHSYSFPAQGLVRGLPVHRRLGLGLLC